MTDYGAVRQCDKMNNHCFEISIATEADFHFRQAQDSCALRLEVRRVPFLFALVGHTQEILSLRVLQLGLRGLSRCSSSFGSLIFGNFSLGTSDALGAPRTHQIHTRKVARTSLCTGETEMAEAVTEESRSQQQQNPCGFL